MIRDEFRKQGLDISKLQIVTHGIDTGTDRSDGDGPRFDDYGAKLMGGPVGSRLFAEQFVGDLADHHATALEAIRVFGARYPRQAINMLMFCSVPRMQHAYSMVPWDVAHAPYARAHSLILTTAAEILGLSYDEARARDVRVHIFRQELQNAGSSARHRTLRDAINGVHHVRPGDPFDKNRNAHGPARTMGGMWRGRVKVADSG